MLDTKQVKEPERTEEERRKKTNKKTTVISSIETNSGSFLPLSKSVKIELCAKSSVCEGHASI